MTPIMYSYPNHILMDLGDYDDNDDNYEDGGDDIDYDQSSSYDEEYEEGFDEVDIDYDEPEGDDF